MKVEPTKRVVPCARCGDRPFVRNGQLLSQHYITNEEPPRFLCARCVMIELAEIRRRETGIAPFDRKCRVCGCTDLDCSGCIEATGEPCSWVAEDLCSRCAE